ncbi:akirin-1-like [Orcinus orca]|uniref:akirin-1-like n=1 Tax=Orcinus orca TaxID=9733 RepID=UPI0021132C97|nr:akirin-1-like [Orcinus orca]
MESEMMLSSFWIIIPPPRPGNGAPGHIPTLELHTRALGWAAVPATSARGSRPPDGTTAGRHCRRPGGAVERGSPKQRRCPALPTALRAPGPRLGAEDRTPPPTLQQPGTARYPGRLPTPEQIFENIKQEYSHYQKWSHSEVVLNQSKAYVSESRSPSSAHPAPSSPGSSWMKNDQSPFTLQQIGIICGHLLKD